jgi:AraC family transcriptional regulator, positive regulator of tynA and feaB
MPVWDVGLVRPRDQFGYWREVICEAFVPLAPRATRDRPEFASRVEVRPLGGLNCAVISSQPQHTAHGPAEVARTVGAYYFLNLQLAGTCVVRQGDREGVVKPGRFTVVDTTEPYYFDFPRDWRMVSFRVPHAQLGPRLPDRALGLGAAVDATRGPGLVVSGLMRALWQLGGPGGTAAPAGSSQWEQSFAAAAAAALCDEAAEGDVAGTDLRRVIERHVQANLQDRDLSVRAVAARFGISPRTLHNLFGGAERSFAAMVRQARLRRCAELLADPSCSCPIADVGASYGFGDPASFSRAFRREFGTTPGEVRRSGRAPSGDRDPVQFTQRA